MKESVPNFVEKPPLELVTSTAVDPSEANSMTTIPTLILAFPYLGATIVECHWDSLPISGGLEIIECHRVMA